MAMEMWNVYRKPRRRFAQWANAIPLWLKKTFETIARTVDTWSDPVFAYWYKPITNACTEAVNGVAKGMNRLRRGYSFDVLRARLVYNRRRAATAAQKRVPTADSQADVLAKFTMGRMSAAQGNVCDTRNASSSMALRWRCSASCSRKGRSTINNLDAGRALNAVRAMKPLRPKGEPESDNQLRRI